VPKQVIGPVIAKRRHVLGLSQEELAVRVGVSRDSVSSWERGKHFPHRHLGKLEQVLGVDLTGEAAPDPVERDFLDVIDHLMPGLSPQERQQYVDLYRAQKRPAAAPQRRAG
jgi:transcriptional regulator with XRE-family HTH domain